MLFSYSLRLEVKTAVQVLAFLAVFGLLSNPADNKKKGQSPHFYDYVKGPRV